VRVDEAVTSPRHWLVDVELEDREGVPHFKPGQIKAWRDPGDDTAALRFCSRMGYAWLILLEHQDGEWHARLAVDTSAGGLSHGWQQPPERFRITGAMRDALEHAEPLPPCG
jgi:hypothetical protein